MQEQSAWRIHIYLITHISTFNEEGVEDEFNAKVFDSLVAINTEYSCVH